MENADYAGFWVRVGASLLDTIVMLIIIIPLVSVVYGAAYWNSERIVAGPFDVFINYVFPFLFIILFWKYKSATPGKMALKLVIVDASTGGQPSTGQLIGRYFAYLVSTIPFCLGFLWVAFDKRKQGWHDKLAGTLVVRQD